MIIYHMSNIHNDNWYEAREEWCIAQGATIGDIMEDAHGDEYVFARGEDGLEKIYLPHRLQSNYIPDLKAD